MQFPATKTALSWCAAWALIGAVAQSSHMAAGGVFALVVSTPAALVVDWWRSRAVDAGPERQRLRHDRAALLPPRLLLPPPK